MPLPLFNRGAAAYHTGGYYSHDGVGTDVPRLHWTPERHLSGVNRLADLISLIYPDRAQKSLGLVNGTPNYTPVTGFTAPDVAARSMAYSADGRLFAYALPTV